MAWVARNGRLTQEYSKSNSRKTGATGLESNWFKLEYRSPRKMFLRGRMEWT